MKKVMYRCDFLIDQKVKNLQYSNTYPALKTIFKPTPYPAQLIDTSRTSLFVSLTRPRTSARLFKRFLFFVYIVDTLPAHLSLHIQRAPAHLHVMHGLASLNTSCPRCGHFSVSLARFPQAQNWHCTVLHTARMSHCSFSRLWK